MTHATEVDSLTEALIEANDLLLGMYDLADVTSQSLEEDELVRDILERAVRIVEADALVLMTPTSRVAVGPVLDQERIENGSGNGETTAVTARQGSGLVGQLRAGRAGAPFSTGDRKLLSAVLRTTLTAVETARLHERAVQSALNALDHQRAAEVAQLALPRTRPQIADIDIFFQTLQAKETGGDLFCFHERGDLLSFAVGDVSGKGLPAAVMMTTAVCATQAAFRDPRLIGPGEELCHVNDWMFDHLSDAGLFITLFIGHYRRSARELTWANAGQSPCLISTANGTHDLSPLTPPIGILPVVDDASDVTSLASGDAVLIGSDGIVEQRSISGEPFGEPRLHDVLTSMRGSSAEAIGSHLLHTVTAFGAGMPQEDDRTVVLLRHEDGGPS